MLIVWAISRALVAIGFFAIAHQHLGALANWDGRWYEKIATSGYGYVVDGYDAVAFFPLYPLVVRLVMVAGIPFPVAGAAVSNVAFLAMLGVAFGWARERVGVVPARWTVAVLAFFPLSLFCSMAYSEALFMLLSALALRDFDRKVYGRSAVWTSLASLTRPSGLWLLPAFGIAGIVERRKSASLWCAAAALTGAVAFGLYCGVRFGDVLAPLHAQTHWRRASGLGLTQWGVLLMRGTYSFEHWRFQVQLLPIVIAVLFFKRMPAVLAWSLCALVVYWEHWSWDRDFPTAAILLMGGAALWWFRKQVGTAGVVYGVVAVLSLVLGGAPLSVDRILYAVLPFSLAIACLFATVPFGGVPAIAAFCFDLIRVAAAFARADWVA